MPGRMPDNGATGRKGAWSAFRPSTQYRKGTLGMAAIRGANMPVYPVRRDGHMTTLADIAHALEGLCNTGANAVAFNPIHYVHLRPGTPALGAPPLSYRIPWYIWPDVGQGSHPWAQTVSPDLMYAAIGEARSMGLKVAIKPMIDVEGGGWRGNISVKNTVQGITYDKTADWFWGYCNRFLDRYLPMMERHDIIILGTEYLQVTRELGPDWLKRVVDWTRQKYPKLYNLAYCANWGGWADDAEFARLKVAMDTLPIKAISAYFPLLGETAPFAPSVEDVRAGWHRKGIDADWCPRIDDSIAALGGGVLAKVMFGEIGYRADDMAAHNPGEDPSTGNLNKQTQANCWQAFRLKWDNPEDANRLAGWFAWSWEIFPDWVMDPRAHVLNFRDRGEAARWAFREDPWKVE